MSTAYRFKVSQIAKVPASWGKKCGPGGRLWEAAKKAEEALPRKKKTRFWRWLLNYKQSLSIH
jgi:hypothetical protein